MTGDLSEYELRVVVIFVPQNQNINKDDVIDPGKWEKGLIAPTTSKYMQMICHYVNVRARGIHDLYMAVDSELQESADRHLPGTTAVCAYMSHKWFDGRRQVNERYPKPLRLQWLSEELDKGFLTVHNLLKPNNPINYVFIPVNVQ